jgi:hypothetical protein
MDVTGSNSETEREALVSRCNEALALGRRGGLESLRANREAGAALRALKELLPRGQFGPIATHHCGCSKQWRSRLMLLDREWSDIEAALHWAEGSGREIGGKGYSVDGALRLLREWRWAQSGNAGAARQRPGKTRAETPLGKYAVLNDRLSAAKAYITVLEQSVGDLESTESNVEPQELDGPTRFKLQRVAARWSRGRTDTERVSAVKKLFRIARSLGWNLSDLLRECAAESPADWTSPPSA